MNVISFGAALRPAQKMDTCSNRPSIDKTCEPTASKAASPKFAVGLMSPAHAEDAFIRQGRTK